MTMAWKPHLGGVASAEIRKRHQHRNGGRRERGEQPTRRERIALARALRASAAAPKFTYQEVESHRARRAARSWANTFYNILSRASPQFYPVREEARKRRPQRERD